MQNQTFKPLKLVVAIFTASMFLTACGGSSSSPSNFPSLGGGSNTPNKGGSTTPGTGGGTTPDTGGGAGSSYTGAVKCKASNVGFKDSLYDDTYVVKASMPNSSTPINPNDANIVETCGFGSVCYEDNYKGVGHTPRNGGKAFCARSVLDKTSPYLNFGSDLDFTEFMRYPTKLEIDCRARIKPVSGSQVNAGKGVARANPNDTDVSKGARPKGPISNCAAPDVMDKVIWPVAYGTGPVLEDFNHGDHDWIGAEFNPQTREIFSVVEWSNTNHVHTATIVAWNVDSKNRRIVSGIYPNSKTGDETFGSGYDSPVRFTNNNAGETQPMTRADDIRLADDGFLYVSSENEIIKVNPTSGKRDLVWRKQKQADTGIISGTYGQCLRPSSQKDGLQLEGSSFEVGPDGTFYKGFRDVRGGNGVMEISKNAKQCKVIARYNARGDTLSGIQKPADVGTGYIPPNKNSQVRGMLVHDGKLYMSISKALVSLDLATGVRERVDDGLFPHSPGYTSMYYDPNRKVIWTSGSVDSIFGNVVVDPITGQKEQIVTDTGRQKYGDDKAIIKSVYPGGGSAANTGGGAVSNLHQSGLGGVIVDPKDADIVYGITKRGALIKLELSTYNNYVHSWGQHK